MKSVIQMELKKSLRTKGFYVSLAVGFLIGLYQTIWMYQNIYISNQLEFQNLSGGTGEWYETGVLEGWLGCEIYSPCNQLYFLIFPLLAALPYGSQMFHEWNSGYTDQIVTRCGRVKYLTAKALAVFVSGGLAVSVPLAVNFIVTACFLPVVGTDPISLQAVLNNSDMWASLFYEHPALYAGAYTGLDFIYGGFFACISLVVTHWMYNRFVIVLFPLLLSTCLYYGTDNLFPAFAAYNMSDIIVPAQTAGGISWGATVVTTAVILVVLILLYFVSNRKRDILKTESME